MDTTSIKSVLPSMLHVQNASLNNLLQKVTK